MLALTEKTKEKIIPATNEEFEKYLLKQRTSTTFNGIEIAEFSRYKKLLGL